MASYRLAVRHDTAANWTSADPVLAQGEFGYETDTGKIKIGDSATSWSSLAYFADDISNDYVDSHLNTDSASTGDFLSWDGSDYVWTIPNSGGAQTFTDLTATSSFTSPGIDDNATTTQLTIEDGSSVFNNDTKVSRAHRYGTAFSVENTSTGGKAWELRSTGVDNLLGTGDLQFNVDSNSSLTLKADRSAEFSGDLTASGNVGIGTDTPSSSYTGSSKTLKIEHSNAATVVLNNTAAGGSDWEMASQLDGKLTFRKDTAVQAVIDESGDVGIGTSTPSRTLSVEDSAQIVASFKSTSTTRGAIALSDANTDDDSRVSIGAVGNDMILQTGNVVTGTGERIRITDVGKVGIGTNTPNANLEVRGFVGAPGTIRASSSDASVETDQEVGRFETYSVDPSGGGVGIASYMSGISESVVGSQFGIEFGTKGPSDSDAVGRVRISNAGNVGIGTGNPLANLDVADYSAPPAIYISNMEGKSWVAGEEIGRLSYYIGDSSGGGQRDAGGMHAINYANASGPGLELGFFTSGTYSTPTEKLRITHTGKVGIGETSPQQALVVKRDSGDTYIDAVRTTQAQGQVAVGLRGGTGGTDWFMYQDASSDNLKFYGDGADRMTITDTGTVGIGKTPTESLRLESLAPTGFSVGSGFYSETTQSTITFSDSNTTAAYKVRVGSEGDDLLMFAGGSERMRIDDTGNVTVGNAGAVGNGSVKAGVTMTQNPAGVGQVRIAKTTTGTHGAVAHYHNGAYVGGLNVSNTSTTLVASSDERLKKNIVDAPAGNIEDIKVRSFDWKSTDEHQEYGVIAQELNEVAPYAVHHNEEEDHWGVDYAALVPMLVKEIQDLKAEVEALKNA